ncbi:hypothetical protein [uncultured Sphingomonas sp.]|uniref:hypothetical protein n=1 Tax=uncultured Sphingomonas sp. TaxID=158754 RepID=UPI0025DF216E|nr:hypothetical protein [uncultured Sphingomonas sp.]
MLPGRGFPPPRLTDVATRKNLTLPGGSAQGFGVGQVRSGSRCLIRWRTPNPGNVATVTSTGQTVGQASTASVEMYFTAIVPPGYSQPTSEIALYNQGGTTFAITDIELYQLN